MISLMISLWFICSTPSVHTEEHTVVIQVIFQDASPKWKRKLIAYVVKNDGTATKTALAWAKGKRRLTLNLNIIDANLVRFSAIESIEDHDEPSICIHAPREKIRIRYDRKIYTNADITTKDAWCEFTVP